MRGARRAAPGDPLRRHARSATSSTSSDAVAAYLAIEHAVGAGGPARGRGLQRRRREAARGARGAGADRRAWRARSSSPTSAASAIPAGEIDRQFVDSTKLREMTGWRPRGRPARRPAPARSSGTASTRRCARRARPAERLECAAGGCKTERHVRALHRHHARTRSRSPTASRSSSRRRFRGARGWQSPAAASTSPRRRRCSRSAPRPTPRRPRRASARRDDALGPGAALGEGPEGRLPDDQREDRAAAGEPGLRAAGRQVPPPLPDRRRRLLRVDEGRGPQAAAPALALHGRRGRALRLRRDLHPQGVGGRGGEEEAGSTAARSSPRRRTRWSPRCTTGCRRSCPGPRRRRPGWIPG